MRKQLLYVLIVFLVSFNNSIAQVGNQSTGSAITPTQSGTDRTPFPYDGLVTFTPGDLLTTGDWNLSIGPGAGASLTSAYTNVLIGGMAGALFEDANVNDNIVIGNFTADQTLRSFDNVYIGNYVARNATNSDNVIIGHRAGFGLTTGFDNTIIGEEAGFNLTDGQNNLLIGEDAGYELTTGDGNCFVGSRAGARTTTTNGNTFVGGETKSFTSSTLGNGIDYGFDTYGGAVGERNTTGEANTFVGSGAGLDNIDGFANTFLGYGAGANNQYADGNTFIGYGTGWDNNRTNNTNDANRNTYMGVLTGGSNREGSDNIGIGWKADFAGNGVNGPSDNRNQRNIFLGNSVRVFGDDQVIIGHQAQSTGNKGSITIGALSSTGGSYAAAIGYDVDVAQGNTMALGGNTTTNRMSVGIGTLAANQNSSLELADIDKGFLVNRVTTVQRIAMETAAASGNPLAATEAGMMVYDTDVSAIFLWNGTQWVNSTTDTDTDDQTIDEFQLNGDDLELSLLDDAEATKTVDLSKYLDNTDRQRIDTLMISGNKILLSLENDNEKFKEVDLGWYLQSLSLSSNTLNISGNTSTVDLSGYLDNTDTQELSLTTNTLGISGNAATIDLSGYLDNTDNQELSLVTNTLSLSGATATIDLAGYLDNTDAQDLELSGNTLSLTNDGTTVDLSAYLDNTDTQTLSLTNGNLSITRGNTIDLSVLQDGAGTDSQNLTSAVLDNNLLTIAIENGNSVTVDLSAILTPLQDENIARQAEIDAQQSQIDDLINRMETVESCACDDSGNANKGNLPILYQNIPNPFNGTSTIKYYLPDGINNASVVFSNSTGQVVSTVALKENGDGELNINSDGLATGTYFYTLYIGSRKVDTKKMVIE
ncbi:T9SS type A sorting domain-containing protein [Aquimarina sp. AU474]|uniref:beta strand repeat-containing protein n=1 Tax=Aquimarina sp. AU474 TaxID=2108529 RepID=UPI000D693ACE|nr:T9SS type A sorting domain-containing protein [Aquimarina sp. AU474]